MLLGTAERREKILRILCQRRYEKISNLAEVFGVSRRTILRDIEILSLTEPIYTQCGRYGGGVYVTADYSMNRMYMTEDELALLKKLLQLSENKSVCNISTDEENLLKAIILTYSKPKKEKEI